MRTRVTIGMLAALAAAVPVAAQTSGSGAAAGTVTSEPRPGVRVISRGGGSNLTAAFTAVESKLVTGQPYSAEAITEYVAVLADGNRITRKTVARVFRDGEGRTRREENVGSERPGLITIYDPVAGTSHVLNPETKTAFASNVRIVRLTSPTGESKFEYSGSGEGVVSGKIQFSGTGGAAVPEEVRVQVEERAAALSRQVQAERGNVVMAEPLEVKVGPAWVTTSDLTSVNRTTTESLGEQMIEGVLATGTRTTTTIPAGAIGNEREINIVSERWFSEELQVLVMTKHSDPQSGDTTYRLTNITRGEPGPGLFEVPADYTVTSSGYVRLDRSNR